ncbi:hypothetical protein [Brucella tritici]|uniref:hypothetical protein n=1 Tax=Brucella tritici TaxID=94626 RepID=UPI00178C3A80|nr:hypothetical protein [Brucella tritici]
MTLLLLVLDGLSHLKPSNLFSSLKGIDAVVRELQFAKMVKAFLLEALVGLPIGN